jgi:hypothetical protein
LELTQEQQALLDKSRERRTNLERERTDFLRRSAEEPEGWISGGARTLASGATEGAAMLAGIPRGLADVSDWALGKVGVPEEYRDYIPFSDAPSYSDMVRKASELTGGYTDYTPETFVGKAAKNITSFVPTAAAAALTGGTALVPTLAAGAVVPGLAGAAAEPVGTRVGELLGAEDPKQAGQYAKIGAEILSPFGATKVIPSLGTKLVDPKLQTAVDEIEKLKRAGINVTPGSYRTTPEAAKAAVEREALNPKIAGIVSKQPEQFSNHILGSVGITDDVARAAGYRTGLSPLNVDDVVTTVRGKVGSQIGGFYSGIQRSQIPPGDFSKIAGLAKNLPGFSKYTPNVPFGEWLHSVRKQAGDIQASDIKATAGKSYSPAATNLINAIDEAMLKALGPDDFLTLHTANGMHSRLTTVRDALARAKASDRPGVITPDDITKSQATRHTQDMSAMADIASKYLLAKGIPLTARNQRNMIQYMVDFGGSLLTGAGGALLFGGGSLPAIAKTAVAAFLGGLGTHGMQKGYQAVKGSKLAQDVAKSHALYGRPVAPALAAPAASAITDREGRKAGGRVGMPHDKAADQLVMAAERAKKGINKGTESLLDVSDNHIAHALEVANRSI